MRRLDPKVIMLLNKKETVIQSGEEGSDPGSANESFSKMKFK